MDIADHLTGQLIKPGTRVLFFPTLYPAPVVRAAR